MKGSEDFFKDKNDDFSTGGSSPRRSLGGSTERTQMIEKIYKQVLGRKPTSREISYYKYSTSDEEEIKTKLLKSDEHKEILKDYKDLPNVKESLKESELELKKKSQKLEDIGKEIIELQKLITSQKEELSELRDQLQNPYSLPTNSERFEEGFDYYHKTRIEEEKQQPKNWREKILHFMELLLK